MPANVLQAPSRTIGQYDLLGKVGGGSMGAVFKARHRTTGDIVAVKVATRDVAACPVLSKRFEQEFHAARALDHPHLVRGLDYGLEDGVPYLVMAFVEGRNLEQHIAAYGR